MAEQTIKTRTVTLEAQFTSDGKEATREITGDVFFFDGDHKFYVAENNLDIKKMVEIGGYEALPMTELADTFSNCECELKFINSVNLETIIPQFADVNSLRGIHASEEKEVTII